MTIARADTPDVVHTVPILIVKGPHCLLGRPTLKKLWPDQYNKLSEIAHKSMEAISDSAAVGEENLTEAFVNQHALLSEITLTPSDAEPPPRRKIPPPPTGVITQEIGEAYCQQLCDVYHELFDGGRGLFKGVTATMYLKPGHKSSLGVRPAAKVPHGIQKEFDAELDKLYETCVPVDGRGLLAASQVVPVVRIKDGKRKIRLCTNYKSTINDHLMDEPFNYPTCDEQLDLLRGEHHSCVDKWCI